MFLWVGCRLPKKFEQHVRSICLSLNEQLMLDTVAFLMPQHISLKISFESDRPDAVLDYLESFLSRQKPFSVQILEPEQLGSILWLNVEENAALRQLHDQLDEQLERRFAIPRHEFDKCFRFHSTLFMDPDEEKLSQMRNLLRDAPLQSKLTVNTFLLGISETGKPGECRIVREVSL